MKITARNRNISIALSVELPAYCDMALGDSVILTSAWERYSRPRSNNLVPAKGHRGAHTENIVRWIVDRHVYDYSLALQDFDGDHPETYIIRGLYILRTQAKLFPTMTTALQKATDPLLLEQRIPRYINGVGGLYIKFEKQFPAFMRELRGTY